MPSIFIAATPVYQLKQFYNVFNSLYILSYKLFCSYRLTLPPRTKWNNLRSLWLSDMMNELSSLSGNEMGVLYAGVRKPLSGEMDSSGWFLSNKITRD